MSHVAPLFPMFVKLEGRRCVVVGAGQIAEAKVTSLLEAGAKVTVIAPRATAALSRLHRAGAIQWYSREFESRDLEGAFLAIAATADDSVNESVYRECDRRGILCNAVDQPPRCHFYFPSVVQRGDLQIAISTSGQSPSLAQRLRRELEEQFGPEYGDFVRWLGEIRQSLMAQKFSFEHRRQLMGILAGRDSFERWRAKHDGPPKREAA
jgi:precorrin-2 dehydrogenase/sirohydrochlorin ferrochelatase